MRIQNDHDLGLVLRERRRELGLDQGELAARVGVSRQWVVEVEKGKPRAEVGLVLRALRVLGLEIQVEDPAAAQEGAPESTLVDLDAILDRARKSEDES